MSTNEIAMIKPSTDLTITPEQDQFTDVQLAALRQLGVEDAPDGDLKVFFHQAKRTGLDPFAKQIYLIGRNTKNTKTNRWEVKYTIQTGIDGYRLTGHRIARARGDQLTIGQPFWRGRDGGWDDVWLDPATPPAAAKITITVNGQPFTAVAMYHEYVQTSGTGDERKPTAMWSKMPANQLRKCAEAAAWRMAYPADFSGLILEDAAQIIDGELEAPTRAARARGTAGLKATLTPAAEPGTAPAEDPPAIDIDSLLDTVALIESLDDLAALWSEHEAALTGEDKRAFSDLVKARKQQLAEQAEPDRP